MYHGRSRPKKNIPASSVPEKARAAPRERTSDMSSASATATAAKRRCKNTAWSIAAVIAAPPRSATEAAKSA